VTASEPAAIMELRRPSDSHQVDVVTCATMSLAEAAEILGIHRTTAWSLHKRGEFPVPVLRIGSNLRVVKAHLQLFIETGEPVVPKTRVGASTSIAS
jgi:Helix-turn-helix domain